MEPTNAAKRRIERIERRAQRQPRILAPVRESGDLPLRKAAFLVVLLWGVSAAKPFLLPLLIAGLLAFLMAPLQRLLTRRLRIPEGIAVVITALALVSPLMLVGYLLVLQGQSLVADFPRLMEAAQDQLNRLSSTPLFRKILAGGSLDPSSVLEKLSSSAGQGLGLLVGGIAALVSVGSQGILILVFAILMLASRKHLRLAGDGIVAQSRSLRSAAVLDRVVEMVQRFLVARMLIVVALGAAATLVLTLFKVQYGIFLGALVGITTLIPAIGFLLALIPTLIVAAVTGHSLGSVLGILASLVVLNLIDNYYLTPKLVGNRVNINALSSFVGLFAGGLLWGVWGMLLSVPVLGILRIGFSAIPGLQPWGELLSDSSSEEQAAGYVP